MTIIRSKRQFLSSFIQFNFEDFKDQVLGRYKGKEDILLLEGSPVKEEEKRKHIFIWW